MGKQLKQISKQQVTDLVTFVTEDFGADMSKDQFTECLLVMLEDVAGCECLTPQQQTALVENAYSIYVKPTV
jgi:hypothetical protein